jgi:23S rRNA (uracil1939-C5)-methyltransferase
MRVALTEMSPSGEAVGRADGLVVFARYALPGEVVEVEITQRRKTYARGMAAKIIGASPDRVTPPCPHFGVCGGCEWQHTAYHAQVSFKTRIVQEQFARIGKLPHAEVRPCIPCPLPYGYRNHTQVAVTADGAIGYREAGSQRVTPVRACPILDPSLEQLLRFLIQARIRPPDHLREIHLRAGVATGERMMAFEIDGDALDDAARQVAGLPAPPDTAIAVSAAGGASRAVVGSPRLHERVGDIPYAYSAATFFQVNTVMAGRLMETVLQALELSGTEHALDLYCGAGLFTAPISARAARVLGIESNPAAARDARDNLRGRANATIIEADVRRGLLDDRVSRQAWQRMVLDPPRAGVDAETLSNIAAVGAAQLVYVSCDPATLARDAGRLREHGYTLRYAQPLDLFPQTHHVETVAVFDRT